LIHAISRTFDFFLHVRDFSLFFGQLAFDFLQLYLFLGQLLVVIALFLLYLLQVLFFALIMEAEIHFEDLGLLFHCFQLRVHRVA